MKKVILLLMLALLPLGAFAQKDLSQRQSQLTYDVPSNGPQGGVQQNYDRAKVDEIVAQIRIAKTNGDVQKSEQLQDELEKVTGNYSKKVSGNNNGLQVFNQVVNQPIPQGDYNLTIINGTDANWATATSTDRVTGRIYVTATAFNAAGSDTLKLFTSADNGISWFLVNKISFGVAIKYRNDELDIEAMNSGTVSYGYIVAGLSYSGVDYSYIFRLNSSGGEFYSSALFGGVAGNRFLFPRITSDNSKYTTASYVYLFATQDSLTGTSHHLVTKFSLITSPFVASPVITERNFLNNGYYWNQAGTGDTTTIYSDIAFSDSAGTDCLISASNFYRLGAFTNLYMTRTKNYGVTTPDWTPQIVETHINWKPRLAATGLDAAGSQYLMLTYVRQFNATDWDPAMQSTSNNGAAWTFNYVDGSTDTTNYADVIAVARIPNTFRFAYSTVTSNSIGKAFERTYNVGSLSARLQLFPTSTSTDFTPVRAGYRLTSDSCFSVVKGLGNYGLYAFTGCTGTLTGVGNSQIPVVFKLSQNYPNPFNPTTKISYALPKSGLATLRVYDILGKEVATLVNEVKAAGNYSVDFAASSFTSGVYFYKLESSGFSDIKKMMLIK